MKLLTILLLLPTLSAAQSAKDLPPARLGVTRGETAGSYLTEIKIERTAYISRDYCAAAGMFGTYPAIVENEKVVRLHVGKKVCKYHVIDTRPLLVRTPPKH